jgi:hypothetical protein
MKRKILSYILILAVVTSFPLPSGAANISVGSLSELQNEIALADYGDSYFLTLTVSSTIVITEDTTIKGTDRVRITIRYAGAGSLFTIEEGAVLTLERITIEGGIHVNGGELSISGSHTATAIRGGISISGGRITVDGNQALNSLITVTGVAAVGGTGGSLTQGITGNFITVENDASLTIENITINGRSGTGTLVLVKKGGALEIKDGATLQNNINSGGNGGAVLVDGGEFIISGGIITGNTAEKGGGVFVESGALSINNSDVFGNRASSSGSGDVHINDGVLTLGDNFFCQDDTFYIAGEVTVLGEVDELTRGLTFDIGKDGLLTWKANLSGTLHGGTLLHITGESPAAPPGFGFLQRFLPPPQSTPPDVINFIMDSGSVINNGINGGAIITEVNTEINGGTISANAIALFSDKGSVVINGGRIFAEGYEARAVAVIGDIIVNGGMVSAAGEECIALFADGNVFISGGSVNAKGDLSAAVISTGGVTITGGTVGAEGRLRTAVGAVNGSITLSGDVAIYYTGRGDAVYSVRGIVTVGNGALLVQRVGTADSFFEGTSTDLVILPLFSRVVWTVRDGVSGITFGEDRFMPVEGVTVTRRI